MITIKPWTPEEDLKLTHLVGHQVQITDIAVQLGRTSGSVSSRAKRLGLPSYPRGRKPTYAWTESEDQTLKTFSVSGGTIQQVVDATGKPYGVVYSRSQSLRHPLLRPDWANHATIF